VAAVLEREGHDVDILDANALGIANKAASRLVGRMRPDLVGITATTPSYYIALDLATECKKTMPEVPIILGGPHVIEQARDILAEACFDYAVFGEGERTMADLAKSLEDGQDLSGVTGLAYKQDGTRHVNSTRGYLPDLDSLPFPSRHLLPSLDVYRPKAVDYIRLPATQMLTSRGCPYRCVFCRTSFGKQVRFHSPDYVLAEIEHLVKDYGVREVKINDDTFIVNRQRVMDICEGLLRRKLDVVWSCNVRADLVDKELLTLMRQSGCWEVAMGLESGSQTILDNLKKGTTVEQGEKACRLAYALGFSVRPSFIIGSPGETLQTIERTIAFAKSLPVHFPSFTLMTPFPGTELWERASEYGSFDGSDLSSLTVGGKASFVPHGLDAETMEKKAREAYRRVYLNPAMVWRHLKRLRTPKDVKTIFDGLAGLLG
jgi:radical SAM superfamily enzyme YgiQ (UPF0313 family)